MTRDGDARRAEITPARGLPDLERDLGVS